eukprot:scaffold663_cov358-Prasinococcus_capsulatus_cf.AAC.4
MRLSRALPAAEAKADRRHVLRYVSPEQLKSIVAEAETNLRASGGKELNTSCTTGGRHWRAVHLTAKSTWDPFGGSVLTRRAADASPGGLLPRLPSQFGANGDHKSHGSRRLPSGRVAQPVSLDCNLAQRQCGNTHGPTHVQANPSLLFERFACTHSCSSCAQ